MFHPLRPGVAKSPSPRTSRERSRRRTRSVLQLESLESRQLLTVRTWTGGVSGNWSTAGNWQGGTAPVAGDELVFPAVASNLTNTNDLAADTSFAGITIEGSGYMIQGASITLGGAIAATYSSGASTILLPMVLGADRTITVASGGSLIQGGAVSGAGAGVSKQGAGTLTFSGTNTFTGGLAIDAGTVGLSAGSAIADGSGVTVAAGSTLRLNASEAIGALSGGGAVDLGANTLTVGGANASAIFSGVISGTGGLTKVGAGYLVLSGASFYSGETTVSAGSLTVSNGAALGSTDGGTTVADGAALYFSAGSPLTVAESITASGSGLGDGALWAYGDSVTLSGPITMAGDLTVGVDTGLTLTISGVISQGLYQRSLTTAGGTTGRVVLSGSNAFTGGVTAASGYLRAAADYALGDFSSATTTIQSGATLELAGGISLPATMSIALVGLPASGESKVSNVSGDNTIAGAVSLADNNQSFAIPSGWTLTLSGDVSGSVDYDKNGAGTLVVSGTTTHTGKINVGDGTLLITGDVSASTSILVDGVLGGEGHMPSVAISSIGTLAPTRGGAGPTLADLGLTAGSKYRVEIGGTTAGAGYSRAAVTGGVDLSAKSSDEALLEVALDSFTPAPGDSFTIIDGTGTIDGTFKDLPEGAVFTSGTTQFRISYADGDVTLTAVGQSTVTPASSAGTSVYGQALTFTATVAGAGATPTGTAELFIDYLLVETATLDASGVATFNAIDSLGPGVHNVVINYSGDEIYASSTASLNQTVEQAETTVTVAGAPSPSIYGESVTFTATVAPVAPGTGTPTGTVTFVIGSSSYTVALVGGVAALTTSSLDVGTATVTATYGGDENFGAATGTASQTVNQASTTTTLVAASNPSVYGQSVTFTATVAPVAPGAGTPTGTVVFTIGSNSYTVALVGGVATLTTSALEVGSTTVTAAYGGDAGYTASSDSVTQTVNQASTTTTVTATPPSAFYGQTVTITATVAAVAPGAGTPTGTVTFTVGATTLTVALVGGVATLSTSALDVGATPVTAAYNGDASYSASTGTTSVAVIPSQTTTTVVGSPNPSVYGESITFTAIVTPAGLGGGVPTGTVTFNVGGTPATVALVGGVATFTTSSLSVGTVAVTAIYTGSLTHIASVGVTSQTVDQAETTVTVVGAPSPSIYGEPVVFTATVAPVAPGAGTPTGTVTFVIGATTNTVALVDGVATYAAVGLALGDYGMFATYNGDAGFSGSVGEVDHSVLPADTTTTVVGAPSPSVYGQAVTFTATVAALSGVPTGAVVFAIGSSTTTVALVDGVATLTLADLPVGTTVVTATFPGGGVYSASAGTFAQTVDRAAATATLVGSPNPSTYGQGVTLTATVAASAPGAGTPAGVVAFYAGSTLLGTAALGAGGVATLVASGLGAGTYSITAVYEGDPSFLGATSSALAQVVQRAASATVLASTPVSGRFGDPITFTATVSPARPGGAVTFYDGATAIGVGTLDASGAASFTTSSLAAGSHAITARFDGDADAQASQSAPLTVTITQSESAAGGVESSSPQVYYGEAVVLSITVTAPSNGGAPMTGTVAFYDGQTFLGSAPLTPLQGAGQGLAAQAATAAGTASLATTLSVGEHVIRAVYSGDANYSPAESEAPVEVVVDPATTSTSLAVAAAPTQLILAARVVATSPGDPALSGTVSFYQGTTLLGTAPLVDGVATLVVPTLPPGDYAFRAVFVDAGGNASGSVESTVASTDGPRVVGLSRLGFHARPTVLVLTFDSPLDPTRAEDLANYRIVDSRGRAVPLASATYDPAARTVTLLPAQRLNLRADYTLTAVGSSPSGLTGATMIPLDGSGRNQPGTDFVAPVTWRALNVPGRPPAVTFPNGRPTGAATPRDRYIASVVRASRAAFHDAVLVLPRFGAGRRAIRPSRR